MCCVVLCCAAAAAAAIMPLFLPSTVLVYCYIVIDIYVRYVRHKAQSTSGIWMAAS